MVVQPGLFLAVHGTAATATTLIGSRQQVGCPKQGRGVWLSSLAS